MEQEWAGAARYKAELGKRNPFIKEGERIATAEEGRVEQDRLIAAAKQNGFFIGLGPPIFEALEAYKNQGGEEHDAYSVGGEQRRVVTRTIRSGRFGVTSVIAATWPQAVPLVAIIYAHELYTGARW